jgi:hypothetical protein
MDKHLKTYKDAVPSCPITGNEDFLIHMALAIQLGGVHAFLHTMQRKLTTLIILAENFIIGKLKTSIPTYSVNLTS